MSQTAIDGRKPNYVLLPNASLGLIVSGLFLYKALGETTQITLAKGTFFNTEGIMLTYSKEST